MVEAEGENEKDMSFSITLYSFDHIVFHVYKILFLNKLSNILVYNLTAY